jgi:[acyl-carrier-protein] S-malonyltransferase
MKKRVVLFPPRAVLSAAWTLEHAAGPSPVAEALAVAQEVIGVRLDTPSLALTACLEDGLTGHLVEMAACVGLYWELAQQAGAPDLITGHSMGIYSALVASGTLELAAGLELFATDLGRLRELQGSLGVVINVPLDQVEHTCTTLGEVWVSGYNSDRLCGVSGTPLGLARLEARVREQGGQLRRFPGYGPWHCQLVQELGTDILDRMRRSVVRDPQMPIIVPLSPARRVDDRASLAAAAAEQVLSPVYWSALSRELLRDDSLECIEVGPGKTLSKFLQGHPAERRRLKTVSSPREVPAAIAGGTWRHPLPERLPTLVEPLREAAE